MILTTFVASIWTARTAIASASVVAFQGVIVRTAPGFEYLLHETIDDRADIRRGRRVHLVKVRDVPVWETDLRLRVRPLAPRRREAICVTCGTSFAVQGETGRLPSYCPECRERRGRGTCAVCHRWTASPRHVHCRLCTNTARAGPEEER